MKLLLLVFAIFITAKAFQEKYGNDFVTYSIGDRYEKGDFLIRNDSIESTYTFYRWPQVHRLEYKIENQDDLLSYAQIDIIDTDQPHEVHINTQQTYYQILIVSASKIKGCVKLYHKAPENFQHFTKLYSSLFNQKGSLN